MNKRQGKRFIVSPKDNGVISIEINDSMKGIVHDICQGGIGFEIIGESKSYFDSLFEKNDFFVKLYLDSNEIITSIKLSWHIFKEKNGETLFIGGGPFSLISKEDNIKIFDYLQNLD